jgi:hypothetical protein
MDWLGNWFTYFGPYGISDGNSKTCLFFPAFYSTLKYTKNRSQVSIGLAPVVAQNFAFLPANPVIGRSLLEG